MRVLITNTDLTQRAGTQIYVRDLAIELLRRGHTPIVYSLELGEVARELWAATVPVVTDLNDLSTAPDLIHGQHHLETMTALLRFPNVPALYVCHGWMGKLSTPPHHPRILRYVAVDHTVRDRLVWQNAIPEDKVEVLFNSADLRRFQLRSEALPERPRRALLFSNYADEHTSVRAVREACSRFGIALDICGTRAGRTTSQPETLLPQYDLVFAKGKSAIEALTVGAAVIICGVTRCGPLVTANALETLRVHNFGLRALRRSLDANALAAEIERYDADDAATVARTMRLVAGSEQAVDALLAVYEEVLREHDEAGAPDPDAEGRAAAAYLRAQHVEWSRQWRRECVWRARLVRLPLVGRMFGAFVRVAAGQPSRLSRVPLMGALAHRLAGKPHR